MPEITCPNCGEVFGLDSATYQALLAQVRDEEFKKELARLERELLVSRAGETEVLRITSEYEERLRQKDEEIKLYRDFKARQSTKMVGESLEQHCEILFNTTLRPILPLAFFEKDNDAGRGSKGDFIYRESAEDGTEFISIMFEMKNEMETTSTKHKNEHFFAKLDKDRREKGCEYAVLVSLLESDSEYYNSGIVDVSHRYPKMYVIRPQFFIPMITLLRNAALNSLQYRQEISVLRSQQLDAQAFEANLQDFKDSFATSCDHAHKNFETVIEDINRTIDLLTQARDSLLLTDSKLGTARGKADKLTIKKLVKGAPTIKALFDSLGTEE